MTTNDVKPLARANSDSDQIRLCHYVPCQKPCYWQRDRVGGCMLGNDLPGCEQYCKRDYRPPVVALSLAAQEAVS